MSTRFQRGFAEFGHQPPPRRLVDVTLNGNRFQPIVTAKGGDTYRREEHVLDGTGMVVLPGVINLHAHYSKIGVVPFEYIHKLYPACGATSCRDVGSDYDLISSRGPRAGRTRLHPLSTAPTES